MKPIAISIDKIAPKLAVTGKNSWVHQSLKHLDNLNNQLLKVRSHSTKNNPAKFEQVQDKQTTEEKSRNASQKNKQLYSNLT